jgi:hypothetical protein
MPSSRWEERLQECNRRHPTSANQQAARECGNAMVTIDAIRPYKAGKAGAMVITENNQ